MNHCSYRAVDLAQLILLPAGTPGRADAIPPAPGTLANIEAATKERTDKSGQMARGPLQSCARFICVAASVLCVNAFCGSAFAQSGDNYAITKSVVSAGGGITLASSNDYTMGATLGQHDAGILDGDGYMIFGGFWSPVSASVVAPAAMTSSPPSKVRYLSGGIPAGVVAGGKVTAIEVELVSMPRFRCSHDMTRGCNVDANCGGTNLCVEVAPFPHEGELRYVQLIGTVQDSEALGTTMVAAALSCEPDYQDWESAVGSNALHIAGAEIVPKGVYHLRRLAASCMGNEPGCAAKSEALMVVQVGWGDVNGDGALNVSDISNEVDVLKDLPSGHLAKYRAQVQPNAPDPTLKPSVQDLANVVDPNKGIGYPFPGPCPCPSSVACSPTTACTGTAECPSGRRCVGGFCSLVDACGRCAP